MSDPMRILNKIDLSDLAAVVGKNGEATKELISVLSALVASLASAQNTSVFDPESLAIALSKHHKMPEMKAPEVRVEVPAYQGDLTAAIQEMEARREAVSYEFNIKRGTDGKIVSVIANPVR